MALITAQTVDRSGLVPVYTTPSASDTFVPVGRFMWLHIKNGSGGSINVNITVPAGAPIQNVPFTTPRTIAVAAGAEKVIGPFPPEFFADPTTGLVTVAYSATASVTVGLFALTQS